MKIDVQDLLDEAAPRSVARLDIEQIERRGRALRRRRTIGRSLSAAAVVAVIAFAVGNMGGDNPSQVDTIDPAQPGTTLEATTSTVLSGVDPSVPARAQSTTSTTSTTGSAGPSGVTGSNHAPIAVKRTRVRPCGALRALRSPRGDTMPPATPAGAHRPGRKPTQRASIKPRPIHSDGRAREVSRATQRPAYPLPGWNSFKTSGEHDRDRDARQ